MLMYWGMRLYAAVGRFIPEGLLYRLAELGGFLGFVLLPNKRANAVSNARVVLSASANGVGPALEQRVRRAAVRSMQAYGRCLMDFVCVPRLLPRVYQDTEVLSGWEHLEGIVESGKGAIVATLHFGNWDLAGAAVAHRLPPMMLYAIADEFENPKLNSLVVEQRSAYGIETVAMSDVRGMLRLLRAGKLLCIVVDRPVANGDGIVVEFFGKQTQIPAGAAVLAQAARCPIVPGYLRRRADGHFEGGILPPIVPVRTGDRAADTAATMQQLVHALEHVIRRSPHQWYMFRAMWPDIQGGKEARAGIKPRLGTLMRAIFPIRRVSTMFPVEKRAS